MFIQHVIVTKYELFKMVQLRFFITISLILKAWNTHSKKNLLFEKSPIPKNLPKYLELD